MLFYNQRLSTAVEDIIILQTQPSKRGKLKTVADPERRRWRFGITMRSVVPFVPLIGDSSCGSNAGVERRFFGGYRRFFAPVKEMGVHIKTIILPFTTGNKKASLK